MLINKYNLCLFKYIIVYTELGYRDVQMLPITTDKELEDALNSANHGITILGIINLEGG